MAEYARRRCHDGVEPTWTLLTFDDLRARSGDATNDRVRHSLPVRDIVHDRPTASRITDLQLDDDGSKHSFTVTRWL